MPGPQVGSNSGQYIVKPSLLLALITGATVSSTRCDKLAVLSKAYCMGNDCVLEGVADALRKVGVCDCVIVEPCVELKDRDGCCDDV